MIQFARGTSSVAASSNSILSAGQPFFETDTNKLKIGNGTASYNDLPYIGGSGGKKYATVVVGTSTAGYTADQVDFLCDGVDDQVEINEAISLSNQDTDKTWVIYLLPGTYTITESIMFPSYSSSNKGQAMLVGSGESLTTIASQVPPISGVDTEGRYQYSADNSYAIRIQNHRVTIMNLTIESDNTPWLVMIKGTRNYEYNRHLIKHVNIVSSMNGICAYAMTNITVDSCTFSCADTGIGCFVGCTRTYIQNCYFQDGTTGIVAQGGNDGFSIVDNYIAIDDSSGSVGVYLDGGSVNVDRNFINSYTGVYVNSSGDEVISCNEFNGVHVGVEIHGGSGNVVSGNRCYGDYYPFSGKYNYYATFIKIVENSWGTVVNGNIPDSLELFAEVDATSHHNSFSNNQASRSIAFMKLEGDYNNVSDNGAYNEYSVEPYNTNYYSIKVAGSNNIIENNILDYQQNIQNSGSSNSITGNKISVQH